MDFEKDENIDKNTDNGKDTGGKRERDARAARDDGEVDYGRREFLSDRRSFEERRKLGDPPPGDERRSGNDRRQVLSERRAPIDRRDMAFFDEFDDDTPLGGE